MDNDEFYKLIVKEISENLTKQNIPLTDENITEAIKKLVENMQKPSSENLPRRIPKS